MAFRYLLFSTALIFAARAQVVQPGAPGENSKTLSAAELKAPPRGPSDADTKFMQGMIMHHSQAVEMTDMMPSRTHNKALLELGKRISISQTDEIKWMKQWLTDRGKPIEMEMAMDHSQMSGMDHSHMDMAHMKTAPMMMPGMLTPEQMNALRKSSGATFDRLFLTGMMQHHGGARRIEQILNHRQSAPGMMQHHGGALTMVQDLFDTPGGGSDSQMYDFATDVDNTQTAEIRIMEGMLKGKK